MLINLRSRNRRRGVAVPSAVAINGESPSQRCGTMIPAEPMDGVIDAFIHGH
jgi:hypothetical protein